MKRLGSYDESYKLALDRNKTILNFNQNKKFKKELLLNTITTYKNFFKKNTSISITTENGIEHSNFSFYHRLSKIWNNSSWILF